MRASSVFSLLVPVALIGGLVLLACGTEGGSEFDPNDPANGANGDGGDPGTFGGGNQLGNGGAGAPGSGNCAATGAQAVPKPVDILIVLDRSGSMKDPIGDADATRRIDAVATALKGFIADPKSAGFGAGLQFFPNPPPAVGTDCSAAVACVGSGAFCDIPGTRVCSNDATRACSRGRDCQNGGKCSATSHQVCSNAQDVPCATVGAACGTVGGKNRGVCTLYTAGKCASSTSYSCDVADYSNLTVAPAVGVRILPDGAQALTDAITFTQSHLIDNTPTKPAFLGGIEAAKAHAKAHPDRAMALIFATDGEPNGCGGAPADLLEATAKDGRDNGVQTYVIGVFDSDAGKATANAIAKGAGTAPIFVTAGPATEADFKAALETIRNAALPCDYDLPAAAGTPDYAKLNVTYTLAGGVTTLPNTTGADACLTDKGLASGWYYDVNPPGAPKKVNLCPATCNAAKAAGNGRVDVVIGCKDTVKVVK